MPGRSAIGLGIIALAYAGVRLWRAAEPCLWFDEIFSVHAAGHSWDTILTFIAKDLIHPPLFYLVLKFWISAGGESVSWIRLLPVLLSVLAMFPFWMLCRELKLRPAAIAAAFGMFAVNGALIKYSQEVRMYSLLLLLSTTSIWLFARYYFRGKSFWALTVVNILLVYTHYFGWFGVGSEVMLIAFAQRIKIARTLGMLAAVAAAFVPWLYAMLTADAGQGISQNLGWMQRPGADELLKFAFDLIEPFYFQQSTLEPAANYIIAIPTALIVLTVTISYIVLLCEKTDRERAIFLLAFAAVPIASAFAASWLFPVSVWGSRHLLIVFVPLILLAAVSLTEFAYKPAGYVLAGLFLVLVVGGWVMQFRTEPPRHGWCVWEGLAADLTREPMPRDGVKNLYVFEDLAAYHFWFAARTVPGIRIGLVKGIERLPNDTAYFLPRGFDEVAIVDPASVNADEIWISFRQPTADTRARFEAPVTTFENIGYTAADVRTEVLGPQTTYLVRMVKGPVSTR